jgi:hypothetical protein
MRGKEWSKMESLLLYAFGIRKSSIQTVLIPEISTSGNRFPFEMEMCPVIDTTLGV